jgi:poly(3-hydroxybutyrate) depolymerase
MSKLMTPRAATVTATAVAVATWLTPVSAQPTADRLTAFINAATPRAATEAAEAAVRAGASFERAYAALKEGRRYSSNTPTGIVRLSHHIGAVEFPYTLDVPTTYDPARRYRVRVNLHGGVMRPKDTVRGGGIGQLAAADRDGEIYVIPTAWDQAPWWGDLQIENLRLVLDTLKRQYNVDENRIVLSGVSDGGTAAFYVAMRDTTPFASYVPLIGHIIVLRNPDVQTSELYPQNLVNKPLFVVNGGRDPLYPAARVTPFMEHFQRGGATVRYLPQREGGHNLTWWPQVRGEFAAFEREHPRDPHPRSLTWETDGAPGTTRAHWLVIDELRPGRAGATPPDMNDVADGDAPSIGIRNSGTRITAVLPGSNAERLGLKPDDVIVRLDAQILPRGVDVVELLSVRKPGDALTLRVIRENQAVDLKGTYEPVTMPRFMQIFPRTKPSGRVDAIRDGNTVTATTYGVGRFTLLLSPDVFDFSRPITVVVDGRRLFDGKVTPSVNTLLKWAARDNDRTMLYGAELPVTVGSSDR